MESFKIIKEIGAGSFANVFKAINKENNDIIAIKRLKQQFFNSRKYNNFEEILSLREVKFMRKINHPFIVKMKEIIRDKDECNLVFEFINQNLLDFYQNNSYSERDIKIISFQCLQALNYIHLQGFFHRDMKPENILIQPNVVKLCDFGLVREIRSRPPFTEYVSTRWYRAPEMLLHAVNYNSPVDIFAMGCIMAELYQKSPLIKGQTEIDQLSKTLQIMGTPNQQQWPEGYKLAKQIGFSLPQFPQKILNIPNASPEGNQIMYEMLQIDPAQRPTAHKLIQNKYFDEIRNDDLKIQAKQNNLQNEPLRSHRNYSNHQNSMPQQNPQYSFLNPQQENNNNFLFEKRTNRNAHLMQNQNKQKFNQQQRPGYAFF